MTPCTSCESSQTGQTKSRSHANLELHYFTNDVRALLLKVNKLMRLQFFLEEWQLIRKENIDKMFVDFDPDLGR